MPYSISLGCHIALGIEREGVGVVEGSGIAQSVVVGDFNVAVVEHICGVVYSFLT